MAGQPDPEPVLGGRSERSGWMMRCRSTCLFRWFVGGWDIAMIPCGVPTGVFHKNRDRLLTTDMSRKFLAAVLAHRDVAPLLSDEHFSVDGTLIKAWASMKSFQPRPADAPPDDGAPSDPPAAAAPGPDADQPARQDLETAEQTDPEPTPEAAAETAPMPKPASRDRETPRSTSAASGARTRPTSRPPIPKRACSARAEGPAPSFASWATRSWRTATV